MEKVGTAWYGFKVDPNKIQEHKPDCHSYGKPYLLIPEESEQTQVTLMVEWHHQGLSYGQIANELETRGYKNRKGNPVQKMTVYRVLKRVGMQHQAPKGLVAV